MGIYWIVLAREIPDFGAEKGERFALLEVFGESSKI